MWIFLCLQHLSNDSDAKKLNHSDEIIDVSLSAHLSDCPLVRSVGILLFITRSLLTPDGAKVKKQKQS